MNKQLKNITLSSAVAIALASGQALADNPFSATQLEGGYQVASAEGKCGEAKCGAEAKKTEKKAEGACGTEMTKTEKKADGKCGEAKCGAEMKKTEKKAEGACGTEMKKTEKKADGKCGEGKCGDAK